MHRRETPEASASRVLTAIAIVVASTWLGCGDGASSGTSAAPEVDPPTRPEPPTTNPPVEPPPGTNCDGDVAFDGTFDAIRTVVFEQHGCTQDVCHGDAAAGGLVLSPDVAYDNLVGAPATIGGTRITAGSTRDSLLWMKLAAAAQPDRYTVDGSVMPIGSAPVSDEILDLLRVWIFGGAPETGTVDQTERFIDGCLPDPTPLNIAPLDPPAAGEGVQFVMPPFSLGPGREREVCFATYYDFSDQIPAEALNEAGTHFRWQKVVAGQDPQSHHLQLLFSGVTDAEVTDPAFGEWTCKGGACAGVACDPLDVTACDDTPCGSIVADSIACAGFGPPTRQLDGQGGQFVAANAGQPREERAFPDGLYSEIPVSGVYFWNSHSFNLTTRVTSMDARINFHFARQQDFEMIRVRAIDDIFLPNNLPFTRERFCADYVVPRGARVFMLSSHTHSRGEHFTIEHHDGTLLYENFIYNEPAEKYFDPPLEFDSADPAERTLRYCGVFNNGLGVDDEPDPSLVTRRSKTPENAFAPCVVVACAEGRLGAPCEGVEDDAACDSSPGAGDGSCDACRITGGVSTENEMFILIGQYYLADVG